MSIQLPCLMSFKIYLQILCIVFSLGLSFTYAQESAPDLNALDSKNIDQKTLDQAETLFFKGLKAYQQKKYDQAAMDFQTAYLLVPNADLLYNVARCREQLKDIQGATNWYQSYLKSKPFDETAVLHHIKEMGGVLEDGESRVNKNLVKKEKQVKVIEEGGSFLAWGTLGLSVLSLGSSIYFGQMAVDEANLARKSFGLDAKSYQSHKDQTDSYALYSDISVITALIALGATTYLWLNVDRDATVPKKDSAVVRSGMNVFADPQKGAFQLNYQWGF
jgi:tetratricopeptide (TPR) repeat protein